MSDESKNELHYCNVKECELIKELLRMNKLLTYSMIIIALGMKIVEYLISYFK